MALDDTQVANQSILSILQSGLALARNHEPTWKAVEAMLEEQAPDLFDPYDAGASVQAELDLGVAQGEPDLQPTSGKIHLIARRKGIRVDAHLLTSTGEVHIQVGTPFAPIEAIEPTYIDTRKYLDHEGAFEHHGSLGLRSACDIVVVNHATALALIFGRSGKIWHDVNDHPLTSRRLRDVPKRRSFPSNGMKAKVL